MGELVIFRKPATTPSAGNSGEGMTFAHWLPNVSGGLVVSKVPQRTDWSLDYSIRLAQISEEVGFDYALTQVRFLGSYGAECQHESFIFSAAVLAKTKRIKVITACLPGIFHPGVVAKQGATADQVFDGRWCINIVSGWFRAEYDALGIPWVEHDERYARSKEFIEILRGSWAADHFSYAGKYWTIKDYSLNPKPLALPGRPQPEIFQGGNSTAAQAMAASVSDWYFMNGNTIDGLRSQVAAVSALAARNGRSLKFGVNAFVIVRDTEAEARDELERIVGAADDEAVEAFRRSVAEAGQSTTDLKGMWIDSARRDLVQYNDGFRTDLVGTAVQVAKKIHALGQIGIDLVLCAFLHFHEETRRFGETVIPLVRELERNSQKQEGA